VKYLHGETHYPPEVRRDPKNKIERSNNGFFITAVALVSAENKSYAEQPKVDNSKHSKAQNLKRKRSEQNDDESEEGGSDEKPSKKPRKARGSDSNIPSKTPIRLDDDDESDGEDDSDDENYGEEGPRKTKSPETTEKNRPMRKTIGGEDPIDEKSPHNTQELESEFMKSVDESSPPLAPFIGPPPPALAILNQPNSCAENICAPPKTLSQTTQSKTSPTPMPTAPQRPSPDVFNKPSKKAPSSNQSLTNYSNSAISENESEQRAFDEVSKLLKEKGEKLREIERLKALLDKATFEASQCQRRKGKIIGELDKKIADDGRERFSSASPDAEILSFMMTSVDERKRIVNNLDIELSNAEQTVKDSLDHLKNAELELQLFTKNLKSKKKALLIFIPA